MSVQTSAPRFTACQFWSLDTKNNLQQNSPSVTAGTAYNYTPDNWNMQNTVAAEHI